MKAKKPSCQLGELLQLAYVENQDQSIKAQDLSPFLNPYVTMGTVKKGEDFIRPGDTLKSIIFVVKGGAYFTRVSMEGNTNMIAAAPAPFFIGITQLVSKDKDFYSQVIAAKNCLILHIDPNYFLTCIREDGEAALVVIRDLAKVVERNHLRMNRRVFLKAAHNLMAYIDGRWKEGEDGGKARALEIREKHGVIAADLGVSVRTLYRAIQALKREGVLSTQKGGVLAVDERQMEKIRHRLLELGHLQM